LVFRTAKGEGRVSKTYKKKEVAAQYDAARAMPDESLDLWMEKLSGIVPVSAVKRVLDLGGGTGRFTGALYHTYRCPVTVLDPSEEMLEQGKARLGGQVSGLVGGGITWVCAAAEKLPFAAGSFDLIWMSQVFHHLEDKKEAFAEIRRVLAPEGCLAVRNGTLENDEVLTWMELFPGAKEIENEKIPHRADITKTVCAHGFTLVKELTVLQRFAASYQEYYEKISRRGLSVLISISDEAFNHGLVKFKAWTENQPPGRPVDEPVDMFIFHKKL
jgi:ubiquinone/menaquinone biosynthesis C-methylase UbiE